jgi:large subunit ribosomal protein LP0
MSERRIRKEKFVVRLKDAIDTYKNVLIVGVDNVGSNQMQKVRLALRGKAIVLMGKNTLIRKILRDLIEEKKLTKLENLLPVVVGNMGFVFTNDNLAAIRKLILDNKVPAAAKSGSYAPADVYIPPGPTGLDPGQTNFFQSLNISTKIVKGAIEISNEVHLIKKGDKVTMSHVALLDKMNIRPFFYGFKVLDVYEDGTVYSSDILDIDQDTLLQKFLGGVRRVAAVSLAIGYPTAASISHSINFGYKKLLALSLATNYEFPESKKFKDYLANPGAFASAAPAAAAAPAAGGKAAAKEEPKKKKVTTEESDTGGGFSMFD